jgi:uncharacterized membrane protein YkoI
MNAKIMLLGVAMGALGAAGIGHAQERVDVRDLPAGVQRAIEQRRDDGPVKQVTRQALGGRMVYDVEFEKNNAPNPRLRLGEDGSVLRDSTPVLMPTVDGVPVVTDEFGSVVAPIEPRLTLNDLPAAVQQTARAEANGRDIADIDRETWNGQPVYELEFKERGLNSRIYVADDGKVVRDERRPAQALRSLFLGTQLEDTPVAVQEAIKRAAGTREILDIDRKGSGAKTIYRVEIRDGQTRQELRIGTDGTMLYDSRSTSTQKRG